MLQIFLPRPYPCRKGWRQWDVWPHPQSRQVQSMCDATGKRRKKYVWSKQARDLVKGYVEAACSFVDPSHHAKPSVRALIDELVRLTQYPRDVCWRFARQLGVNTKQQYHEWTPLEQQRLLDLIALNPPQEVAKIMRRSVGSVRGMLQRLDASAQMGRDWFTAHTLAQALYIRSQEVQRWIDQGWLKSRVVETGALKKHIIDSDAFVEFCKTHGPRITGRRLHRERLEFVYKFVFPPSHAELLPLRQSGYKKKTSAAVNTSMRIEATSDAQDTGEHSDVW
ncbi:MAG: hypothetical protein JWQ87_5291 [Candidatus Sulfotelmatobacter sp.]|nr:hypothetical protein [Candidatus Sulfotelmatobacter sp.]